jgi:uncharacterized protein (DUF58 family)
MYKTVKRKSRVLCSRRGYYTAGEAAIACNNILLTDFYAEPVKIDFGLLVYPKLIDYPETVIPLKKMFGEMQTRAYINPNPFTFKGIREYQPFDGFRQINWKATARTGELMSNIYDSTLSQDITVVLDLRKYCAYDRDFVFEEAIRIAAFVCRKAVANGVGVGLVCPGTDGNPVTVRHGSAQGHLDTVYTALAYINLNARIQGIGERIDSDMPGFNSDGFTVLISPYHGEDLVQRFRDARDNGEGAFWILPYCERDEVTVSVKEDGVVTLYVES